ncbi:ClbS/DfsB family four-helix bundle protein [Sphingobacterium faecale]|uniref:ClbS/DfsB family four-helix bundle protein n=1 Tax=Sphingobacterium faecale TaxID=2803775 RepID=A0ABS1QYH5_9SPHI|nr:ClbS/DfsB family four-helix bundle protein [Sphingobacterium faecale]MBL1407488.1 ClbS/DfsB family four-helix bundle protein [Sphingobacterium faecale]
MARPTNKESLITLSQSSFNKLLSLIDNLPDPKAEFPLGTMNRNVRDVLGHLHHWHLLMLEWYKTGSKGEKPVMPAIGYSWKDTPALNKKIWEDCQSLNLQEVRQNLMTSYGKIQELIDNHTNSELFEKKKYKWTGSTSLGSYLISATSSHYDWAFKLIKKASK